MSTDMSVGCEECDFKGWVHSHEPFEIQRCDTCAHDGWYDEDAIEAHKKDCGCDWPDRDYQDYLLRQSFFGGPRTLEPELAEIMERFHEVASFRDLLLMNRYVLMAFVGEAFCLPYEKREFQDDTLRALAVALLEIQYLTSVGKWPAHWLWSFDDGIVIDEKWFAKKPIQDPLRKLPLVQSSMADVRPDLEYIEKVNEYVEKIRALGAGITFLHDETIIDLNKDSPNLEEVHKLATELAQFQVQHQMKNWQNLGAVPLKAEADYQKTWEESAKDFQTPLEIHPDADIPKDGQRNGEGCKRCGKALAYPGAVFCGAGCSARWEGGDR